jgi:ABC-type sugar transport system substrate-binding protein
MSQMSPPRDGTSGENVPIGGNLVNPYVGFDNYDAGRQQTYKLIEWKEETSRCTLERNRFVAMAFSVAPPLSGACNRRSGCMEGSNRCTDNFA